jgi:hypothetical protein
VCAAAGDPFLHCSEYWVYVRLRLCHSFGSYFLLRLYVRYFSSVFKCFLCVLIMSIISIMVSYLCQVFNMWFQFPELL